jgi:hypothetical protein
VAGALVREHQSPIGKPASSGRSGFHLGAPRQVYLYPLGFGCSAAHPTRRERVHVSGVIVDEHAAIALRRTVEHRLSGEIRGQAPVDRRSNAPGLGTGQIAPAVDGDVRRLGRPRVAVREVGEAKALVDPRVLRAEALRDRTLQAASTATSRARIAERPCRYSEGRTPSRARIRRAWASSGNRRKYSLASAAARCCSPRWTSASMRKTSASRSKKLVFLRWS